MYTLRFPFLLTNNTSINNLESPITRENGGLTITLEFNKPYYILLVKGFKSELEAKAYKKNLKIGLNWATLNCNFGFEDELEFDKVYFPPDPYKVADVWRTQFEIDKGERIDCIINGNLPSVYPSQSVIGILTGGMVSVIIGKNPNSILDSLLEGVAISFSIKDIDIKLKIAIDIYNGHFFEQSNQAKFLSLVMVLESIAPHNHKHQIAQNFIDYWIDDLNLRIAELKEDSEEYHSLESLRKEISFRREASIRSQIRTLVLETLNENNNHAAVEYAKKTIKLYDTRSILIHDGIIDSKTLEEALSDAREIVLLVLKYKLKTSK